MLAFYGWILLLLVNSNCSLGNPPSEKHKSYRGKKIYPDVVEKPSQNSAKCPCLYGELSTQSVKGAFESSKIVPDVVCAAPTKFIKLTYPSGAAACLGNELTPTQVKSQPSVWYEADDCAYYTLIFTDPDNYDGPDPIYREFHHWLVGNIPGNNVNDGEVLSAYIGSGPPEGTGLHRYIYVLFKQPDYIKFDEKRLGNTTIDGRQGFSTKKFVEKYCLGRPVAGNFYRAEYDDYVRILYESLGAN